MLTKENLKKLSQHGYVIRKVDIDVEELLSWYKLNHRAVDANSRSEFAVIKLQELDKKTSQSLLWTAEFAKNKKNAFTTGRVGGDLW